MKFSKQSKRNQSLWYISIDNVGKSKHNKTLLGYKESKDRQHVSALLL